VSIVTKLWAGCLRSDYWQGQGFISLSPHTDWLWGPPSLLSNGYQGLFHEYSLQGMKLTTHIHLVQSLRMHWAIPPLHCISSWH